MRSVLDEAGFSDSPVPQDAWRHDEELASAGVVAHFALGLTSPAQCQLGYLRGHRHCLSNYPLQALNTHNHRLCRLLTDIRVRQSSSLAILATPPPSLQVG